MIATVCRVQSGDPISIPDRNVVPCPVNPSSGFSVVLRAKREILEGEEVTIQVQSYLALLSAQCQRAHAQYVPPSLGQPVRQHHLAESWYMECDCKRCEDASEFGTFVSAVKVGYL